MKLKRLITIFLIVVFSLLSCGITLGNVDPTARNFESTIGYTKLAESFGITGSEIASYPSDFGGAYIGDDGILVIQYVENQQALDAKYSADNLKNLTGLSSVKVESVTYAFNDLVIAANSIGEYIENKNDDTIPQKSLAPNSAFSGEIVKSAVSAKDNAVIIWLDDPSESNIEVFRKEVYEAPFLIFEQALKERPTQEKTYKSGEGFGSGSIGFPAYKGSVYGFVTAYHCTSGSPVYLDGVEYGYRHYYSASKDFAFVAQTHYENSISRSLYDTTKTLSAGSYIYVVQGSSIAHTGDVSGFVTGTVTATNVTIENLGSGLFETNCSSYKGDSGGPYFSPHTSSTTNIAGIHIGGYDGEYDITYFRGIADIYSTGIRI